MKRTSLRVSQARYALRDDPGLTSEIMTAAWKRIPAAVNSMRADYYGPADLNYHEFAAKWERFPLVAAAIVILR